MRQPSHLFITRANIANIACDAWLLPTDAKLTITPSFHKSLSDEERRFVEEARSRPGGPFQNNRRVVALASPKNPDSSRAWLTDVGAFSGMSTDWFVAGLRQFLTEAGRSLAGKSAMNKRARPLVAVPLIGTGDGGLGGVKGAAAEAVIKQLLKSVKTARFDIVLVAYDGKALAACQQLRTELSAGKPFGEIPEELRNEADALAALSRSNELVLFIGAGVSAGAGLPGWSDLLALIGAEAGLDPVQTKLLAKMDGLDQALFLEARLKAANKTIGNTVTGLLRQEKYSLGHSLLASLPVSEVATTNYDCLFEKASFDAGREVATIPYEPAKGRSRWLLKMHGSVTRPDDIVLTRSDYLRYAERRAALSGIVQALLITRHMLFVGFSLTDDNFYRIADEVRRALRDDREPEKGGTFGTSLLLEEDEFFAELWTSDLNCVAMTDAGAGLSKKEIGKHRKSAARQLELFLDCLLSRTSAPTAHLMDTTYDDVLTQEEQILRKHIEDFLEGLPAEARDTAAWPVIESALNQLGLGKAELPRGPLAE